MTPITPRNTYPGTLSRDPRGTDALAKMLLPRQHLNEDSDQMLGDRHKQAQTLPCRLSQTPDHPTWGTCIQPQTCTHVNMNSTQTPPHSPAVPLAQARAELSLITILSVSTATQMERAWEWCPGVPRPTTGAGLENRSAPGLSIGTLESGVGGVSLSRSRIRGVGGKQHGS